MEWRSVTPGPFPADRRCAEADCITLLSRWNPGPECFRHSATEPISERDYRGDLADVLDELLGGSLAA